MDIESMAVETDLFEHREVNVFLKFPSPTFDVALNYGDRIGLGAGVDALRDRDGSTQWQEHAGIRFGTWLAPLATLGLGLLIGATW
jgi:hypothetical protein